MDLNLKGQKFYIHMLAANLYPTQFFLPSLQSCPSLRWHSPDGTCLPRKTARIRTHSLENLALSLSSAFGHTLPVFSSKRILFLPFRRTHRRKFVRLYSNYPLREQAPKHRPILDPRSSRRDLPDTVSNDVTKTLFSMSPDNSANTLVDTFHTSTFAEDKVQTSAVMAVHMHKSTAIPLIVIHLFLSAPLITTPQPLLPSRLELPSQKPRTAFQFFLVILTVHNNFPLSFCTQVRPVM